MKISFTIFFIDLGIRLLVIYSSCTSLCLAIRLAQHCAFSAEQSYLTTVPSALYLTPSRSMMSWLFSMRLRAAVLLSSWFFRGLSAFAGAALMLSTIIRAQKIENICFIKIEK